VIAGANFVSGATVSFGGSAATGVSFVDSGTLNATTPAHSAGAVDVSVTNPSGGGTGTAGAAFTYVQPQAVTAAFTWSPTTPAPNQSVQFTDQSTGSPTFWCWSFGDSSGAVTQNPTHTYTSPGQYTVFLSAGNASGGTSVSHTVTVQVAPTSGLLYLVTPCRLIDTRNPNGPFGGPSLSPGSVRNVAAVGNCGIPSGATGLAVNLTSVGASTTGWLTLFPGQTSLPFVSTLNYTSGKVLANNATVPIGADGSINIYNSGPNAIHFIVDVNAYFK
jgi:PKD repeat protein